MSQRQSRPRIVLFQTYYGKISHTYQRETKITLISTYIDRLYHRWWQGNYW